MKRILLIFTLAYLGTLVAFAQSLSLSYGTTQYSNGDLITFTSTSTASTIVSHMWVANNSANDIVVRVKKIELDTVPGSENYFCWTSCYLPMVYVSDTMTIKAGEINKSHFSGDYDAFGNAGKTKVMYVFYNDANINDSVAFIAEYYAGSPVSFSTVEVVDVDVKVYPNPAKDFVFVDFKLPSITSSASIQIRNVLGSIVYQSMLTQNKGVEKIDVSQLKDGVYFYSLIINNDAVVTRKLLVRK
ncbi:MAG: T9SS type A sorting domain-containing protein [Bacteroidales bacterium]|nr:T9SS type A sorting domain-containing protein [Bacteroidales bacterium]